MHLEQAAEGKADGKEEAQLCCSRQCAVERGAVGAAADDGVEAQCAWQRNERGKQPRRTRDNRQEHGHGIGNDEKDEIFAPRPLRAPTHRKRLFARGLIAFDVAQVVDDEDGGDERADCEAGKEGGGGDGVCLHIIGATNGDGAEKEKDKEIAQPHVAKGLGATCVGKRGEDGCEANGQDGPAAHPNKIEADKRSQPKDDHHAHAHGCVGDETRGRDARRADALRRVGTFDGVEIVVGKIRADLQQQRAQQRGERG